MSAHDFKGLLEHVGHDISCHTYSDGKNIFNVAIACEDCQAILLDFDNPDLEENDLTEEK